MDRDERTYFGGPDDFPSVRHLRLRGSNHDIGRALGELVRDRYGRTASDYDADPLFVGARRAYFQTHYAIHWQRVCGIAEAFGVDAQDDRYDLSALRYHMDLPNQPGGPNQSGGPGPATGCSVVYCPPSAAATGTGWLSRNYDFSTGTLADLLSGGTMPGPPGATPVVAEPYVMEWYPDDGGYASVAIQAFDCVSGTLDGINSAGLVVSIMADEDAMGSLGPHYEPHLGPPRITGLHELQVMRWVLDTCATAAEARAALLGVKQYYLAIPCHYLVADEAGDSFVYQNSTGRNVQHVVRGQGRPQLVTNFQLSEHPNLESSPDVPLTLETNALWRYQEMARRLGRQAGPLTRDDLVETNACVNVRRMLENLAAEPQGLGVAAAVDARTLWHSLYDQAGRSVEISFYLGESPDANGRVVERRSEYLSFGLNG